VINTDGTSELVASLKKTLHKPLDEAINKHWCDLYDLLRKQNPGAEERKIDEAARTLVWGCR